MLEAHRHRIELLHSRVKRINDGRHGGPQRDHRRLYNDGLNRVGSQFRGLLDNGFGEHSDHL